MRFGVLQYKPYLHHLLTKTAIKQDSFNVYLSKRLCSTIKPANSIVVPPSHRVPPQMDFLKNSSILLDTIDGTIEAVRKLLDMLKRSNSPKEKHDILDSCSNILCLFLDPCEFVRQIHPDPAYRKSAAEAFTHVHEFMCEVNSRRELYDVLLELDHPESRAQLSSEENKNITQLKRDMEANGIHLPESERIKITESNVEKEELTMRFIAERDDKDPFGNLRNLLLVRYDQAQMLGWESSAHQLLQNTMMRNPENVWHFLCSVAHKYRPHAERELLELERHQGKVKLREKITDKNRAIITNAIRESLTPRASMTTSQLQIALEEFNASVRKCLGLK